MNAAVVNLTIKRELLMARRQRFFHTDYFNLIPPAGGRDGQQAGNFGASIANFWGNDLTGVTVGPFWYSWWPLTLDTGTEGGGIAWGVVKATDEVLAGNLPDVQAHGGRYVVHQAVHVRLNGILAVAPQLFDQLGMVIGMSKAQVKVERVEDTLFVCAGLEVAMDVSVRIAITAMVVLP